MIESSSEIDGAALSARWWHDAVGYEVYLRSFGDSDGDGVGDLAGVTARLDHLEALGIDLLWITQIGRASCRERV